MKEVQYALYKTKDHPRGDEIYALLVGYLYFGCRATELLPPYITWDKYDGESLVRPNFKQGTAEVEWITVPLNGYDGEVLKKILDHRLEDQEKWSSPFPYTYWQVRGLLTARYFKQIGLKANLQTLRDTAATLRQLLGLPLSAVSALLGHSSTSVTTKYYTDKDKLRGAVAGSLNITKVK
jgi:integrase